MMDLTSARQAIRTAQLRNRPRGMPPKAGLLYQPVPFEGFEDLGCERNGSEDRLIMIRNWLSLKAPAKVLDLGCANGFFLFRLAQLGLVERGIGVDYFDGNVKTCSILAQLHGLDQLSFQEGTVSPDFVDRVTTETAFDVVIWLSVHHHIVRTQSIDAAKRILRLLYDRSGVVIVEQGSITSEEYEQWTGRSEPFTTRAYSRLLSLAEATGIPMEHAFCIGMGRYLSGERDDMEGAGRVILGFSRTAQAARRIQAVHRKTHKNGINMEIMELGSEVWKNVVAASRHHARREATALRALADEPGFVRCQSYDDWELNGGLVRLRQLDIRAVTPADLTKYAVRDQAIQRLMSLAGAGIVHGELHAEHLQLTPEGELVCIDLETARMPTESAEDWFEEVAAHNPALGLGSYTRQALKDRPDELDVLALNSVLEGWGLPPLHPNQRDEYATILSGARV